MRIPFKNIKQPKDPKRELPIQAAELAGFVGDGMMYEDIYISKDTFINVIFAGSRGIFVFIAFDDKDGIDLLLQAKEVKTFLPVARQSLFIFFLSKEKTYAAEQDFKSLIELESFSDSFQVLLDNLSRPAVDLNYLDFNTVKSLLEKPDTPEEYEGDNSLDGMTYEKDGVTYRIVESYERYDEGDPEYVRPIVDQGTLDAVDALCSKMIGNPYPDATYRVDEEGNEYILRDGSVKIKGIDTGLIGSKQWYRISDRDPVKAFAVTVFGGWFGLHRLAAGNLFMFVTYLLTCGFCGVFYILDVLSWVFGNASYEEVDYYEDEETGKLTRVKDRVYFKKLPNKLMALGGLVLSVGITFIAMNLIYKNAYNAVILAFTSAAMKNAGM